MLHSFNSWSDSKQTAVCFSQVGNDPHLPDTDGYTEPVISKKQEKKKKEKGRERENARGETQLNGFWGRGVYYMSWLSGTLESCEGVLVSLKDSPWKKKV